MDAGFLSRNGRLGSTRPLLVYGRVIVTLAGTSLPAEL
jgi:hypothetical protein